MSDNLRSDSLEKELKQGRKHIRKAKKLMNEAKWEKAHEELKVAEIIFQSVDSPLMLAQAVYMEGVNFENQGLWEQAIECYQTSLELRGTEVSTNLIANTQIKIAQMQIHLQKLDQAHEFAQKAYDLLENENFPLSKAEALYVLGSIYLLQNDAESSIFYYNLALEELKKQNDWNIFLKVQENRALAYQRLSKYKESNESYSQALKMEQKVNNFPAISTILEKMSENYKNLNEKEIALSFVKDTLAIRRKLKNGDVNKLLSQSLITASEIHLYFREFEKAEAFAEEAIEIAEKYDITNNLSQALLIMVKILIAQMPNNEIHKDIIFNYLEEARKLAENIQNHQILFQIYLLKVQYYKKEQNMKSVFQELEDAEKFAHQLNNLFFLGSVSEEYGIYYYSLGDLEIAIDYFEKAIESFETKNAIPELAEAHYNKSCASCRLHLGEEAMFHLKKAIDLNEKYKLIAKTDEDFKSIWNDAPFQKLVNN